MVVTSVLALLGVGAAAAVLLAIASRVLRVEENPLVEAVTEVLPGANCGGCGFAGCEAFAVAVVTDPNVPANGCVVANAEINCKVGELSGKAVADGEPVVAFRRCSRVEGNVALKYDYMGSATCASAALLEDGPYACSWACLGFGDCMRACPFDAMYMEDGLVEVVPSKCVSCGQCVKACPRGILQLTPVRARVMVHCATHDKMKAVMDVCDVGCINCGKCIKACPAKAVRLESQRIEIDHQACMAYGPSCGEACVTECPRKIMRHRSPAPERPVAEAPVAADASQPVPPSEAPSSEEARP